MKNFCLFRILILTIIAASVGSAIAKEKEPFLPTVKNAETETKSKSKSNVGGEGEANGFLASASGAGEDRLLPVPFKNAETETKSAHRRTTVGEADEAGTASPPNSDEGGRKRSRQHELSAKAGKQEVSVKHMIMMVFLWS